MSADTKDLEPVDLDSPLQLHGAVERWNCLADESFDRIEIDCGDDAEKVMPMRRPSWADPEKDNVGIGPNDTFFASSGVSVPATLMNGWVSDNKTFKYSRVKVSVRQWGHGASGVVLTVCTRGADGMPKWAGIGLTATEADDVARVLLAAADLIKQADA